jgi:glucosyl-dolichyl phosphate glucuronosyltransferase
VPTIVTVAICTLNRAASLRRTLESLAAMRLPDRLDWEVVVVNNGCTDDTDMVIVEFAEQLPVRREFEPQRGLSRARNRAVDAARGDYIVWTDDDVIVDPGWLAAYTEAFRRWPEAAVFGGPIIPRYTAPVPKWLEKNKTFVGEMAFCARDFGDQPIPLSNGRIPYGPNFAIHTETQRACTYDLQLGHAPDQRRRSEESDVIERVLRSGVAGYWIPQARVEHCASPEQQTERYIRNFLETVGEAEAFRNGISGDCGPIWFGAPRWAWRQLLEEWLLYRIHRLISSSSIWLSHLNKYGLARGRIRCWIRRRA